MHKILPVYYGPFMVTDLDIKTVWIKYPDGNLELVSVDRLRAAPESCWPYVPNLSNDKHTTSTLTILWLNELKITA